MSERRGMHPLVRKLLPAMIGLAVLWLAAAAARRQLGVEFEPQSMRNFVAGLGSIAPIVFVLLVTFRAPLGLPSQLLLIAGGLCFGAVAGTLYGALGIIASGSILFGLSRWMGRELVESHIPAQLRPAFEDAGGRGGAAVVALGTAYPLGPITAYHALAGVTGMGIAQFSAAILFGASARSALYTFFGSSLVSQGRQPIVVAGLLLAAVCVAPLLFQRSRRWVLQLVAPRSLRKVAAPLSDEPEA